MSADGLVDLLMVVSRKLVDTKILLTRLAVLFLGNSSSLRLSLVFLLYPNTYISAIRISLIRILVVVIPGGRLIP